MQQAILAVEGIHESRQPFIILAIYLTATDGEIPRYHIVEKFIIYFEYQYPYYPSEFHGSA